MHHIVRTIEVHFDEGRIRERQLVLLQYCAQGLGWTPQFGWRLPRLTHADDISAQCFTLLRGWLGAGGGSAQPGRYHQRSVHSTL